MQLRSSATRASLSLSVAAVVALSSVGSSAGAQDVLRYGVGQATIAWAPPDEGLIDAYVVYVARNGGIEQISDIVDAPLATIRGDVGDRLVARVLAIGRAGEGETLVASAHSPPSPTIRFMPAPVWPAAGFLALHCADCAQLQVRPTSNQGAPAYRPAPPAPWRLVDLGAVAPGSYDEVWQNTFTGELLVVPFGAGVENAIGGSINVNTSQLRAEALVELDGDDTRELLVRDDAGGSLQFWEYRWGNLVPIGGVFVPPAWRLGGTRDFDGDGRSDLWWQTEEPGRVEVWQSSTATITGLLLRVDTGAAGDIVAVGDVDGDGRPEPLWRTSEGALTVSYLRPGEGGSFGSLDRNVTLVGVEGDEDLVVRGLAELNGHPGEEILVQNDQTYGVSAIFPSVEYAPARAPLFDLTERYELVFAR